jgi:ABC-type iron transport system FetAB permease component
LVEKEENMKIQFKHLIYTAILMTIGTLVFKSLPMYLYGEDILFDASRHIIVLSFGLYFLYYLFIQNKESWKLNYVIFSSMILGVIAVQRILAVAHNEYGVLMGFAVAGFSIFLPLWLEGKR